MGVLLVMFGKEGWLWIFRGVWRGGAREDSMAGVQGSWLGCQRGGGGCGADELVEADLP